MNKIYMIIYNFIIWVVMIFEECFLKCKPSSTIVIILSNALVLSVMYVTLCLAAMTAAVVHAAPLTAASHTGSNLLCSCCRFEHQLPHPTEDVHAWTSSDGPTGCHSKLYAHSHCSLARTSNSMVLHGECRWRLDSQPGLDSYMVGWSNTILPG